MSDRARMWKKRFISYPRRRVRGWFSGLRSLLRPPDYGTMQKRLVRLERNQRRLFAALHAESLVEQDQRAGLRSHEFQALTENGEAGILLYLFSRIGAPTRRAIEFGTGDVIKCNTANLVIHFGWSALLVDGAADCVEGARRFFASPDEACVGSATCVQAWLARDSINELFREHGFTGEIDLLSVDVDGIDYWLWQAIDSVAPRVVVAEYNSSLGPDLALTAKYEPRFSRYALHPFGWHHGASLAALAKLGSEKGYVLVGCESMGHNAFFVRRDLAEGHFRALTPQEAFYPNARRLRVASHEAQLESLRNLPWENV